MEEKLQAAQRDYLKLWRERFEARSERYIADPDQLRIDFDNSNEAADVAAGLQEDVEEAELIPAHLRRKGKPRSEALPAHLPRVDIEVDAEDSDKTCLTYGAKKLLPQTMWDVREKLICQPAKIHVQRYTYKKYVCAGQPECGVATASRPAGLVEGDKYDTSVAAQIISSKYRYHLPLYRQQDVLAGSGWTPSRSTLTSIL